MRIQEDWSWPNNIRIDLLAVSPNKNWEDTENKLHQMLYDYFSIAERVVIKRAHRVEKWDKPKQGPPTIVAKLLNYKEREYILKNTHHLKTRYLCL